MVPLSQPSDVSIQLSDHRDARLPTTPARRTFPASAFLAIPSCSAVLGDADPWVRVEHPGNSVALQELPDEAAREISLAEACRMAQELNERVESAYRESLDLEAAVPAVWEDDE